MEFNIDDLRKAIKFLSVPPANERLESLIPVLNQTFKDLEPLKKLKIAKEIGPTSYLDRLRELEES